MDCLTREHPYKIPIPTCHASVFRYRCRILPGFRIPQIWINASATSHGSNALTPQDCIFPRRRCKSFTRGLGRVKFFIFSHINEFHGPVTRKLTQRLSEAYAPLAEGCCKAILTTLSSSITELNSGTGTFSGFLCLPLERDLNVDADVRSLAFLSRLTEALHASPFCSYLKCETLTGIGTSYTSCYKYALSS
jgi:hypothetical protein